MPTTREVIQNPNDEEKTWAMLCHLSSFLGFFIPFGNILGPFVIWLVKGRDSPFVDYHGKESLNFQLSMTIYFLASFFLMFILIGFPLFILLVIFEFVAVIIATVQANSGKYYRYPTAIHFFDTKYIPD